MSDCETRLTCAGGPSRDDLAAVLARARPEVDDVVGGAHRALVVLDDDHRVAEVAQARERVEQLVVVALVQADRGLVEDVEHADEARPDLGREPDPLRLAARQRRRRALERQVADADAVEEAQPLDDLLQDPRGDLPLGVAQLELVEERDRLARRLARELVDADARRPCTARLSGRRRAPLHSGHGRTDMYSSIRSREYSESVSR